MEYKKMLAELTAKVTHAELAEALGVSVATIRQAALPDSAKAHRPPPAGWEATAAKLAKQKAAHFQKLATSLV